MSSNATTPSADETDPLKRLAALDWVAILALAVIAFWAVSLVDAIGKPRGWLVDGRGVPVQADFNGVYTAGKFVLGGEATAAYDWERHKAAQHVLTADPAGNFYPWPYPPTFLFMAGILALLPYTLSMLAWAVPTLAAFAAVLFKISVQPRHALVLLAMPAVWLNLYVGQNGAATAALIGFGLALLPTRPLLAGLCFGLLSFKPHLGVLLPIALAAGGYWRSFMAAGVTVAALIAGSLLAFGVEPWLAMPGQLDRVMAIVGTATTPQKIQSVFGLSVTLGIANSTGMAAQMALLAALAVAAGFVWRRADVPFDLKAALLATAMTLASPYQFVYDLPILTIAQAFLLRHLVTARGVTALDIGALALANVLVFKFAAASIPLGVFGAFLVLALVGYHIWWAAHASQTSLKTVAPANS